MKRFKISKKFTLEIFNGLYKGGLYFNVGLGFSNDNQCWSIGVDLGFVSIDLSYSKNIFK